MVGSPTWRMSVEPGAECGAAWSCRPPSAATSHSSWPRWRRTGVMDYKATIRRMGQDGWLGLGWPAEYGGQGRGPVDQMIFVEESHRARVALPLLTLGTVGPAIMQLGTPEQKARILPGILRGDRFLHRVHRALGRHRPGLAANPRRTAETSGSSRGRSSSPAPSSTPTSSGSPRVPTRGAQAPGPVRLPRAHRERRVQLDFLRTIAGEFTSATYYDGVRIPGANLIGERERRIGLSHQPAQPGASGDLPGLGHSAFHRGGQGLGGVPTTARWPPDHRSRVGANRLGAPLGPGRCAQALELEGGLGGRQGFAAGRRLGDEGLRERIRPRGLPGLERDRGTGRVSGRRLAGRSAPWKLSNARPAPTPSSPSEAAPTRSSAT